MAHRFWRERGCAVVVFAGDYEPASALETIDAALGEGGPADGLLLDLTDSHSFRSRSTDGLRRVATFLSSRRERFGSRLATVGRTDLAFGLLRMGMVFTSQEGIQSEAFRSHEEAMAWLCAPEAAAD